MKKKFLGRLLTMLLVAAMVFTLLPASAIAAAEWWGGDEYADDAATQATDDYKYNIFFLDCGRKYYSVNSIKQFIDNASAAGFNYIQLAVGNDGLRFLLNDMSLTVNGTTYESDAVKSAIHTGNEAYYNFDVDELTQSEMDTIIDYANSKGMGVIPCVNTPGHMDAILSAANTLTGKNCSYNSSVRTIDVTNTTATAFTKALLQKYITYFAGKGCQLFNMGADEYANDKYTSGSMGFGNLQSTGNYSYYVTYVNEVAAMIKAAKMIPMAFNDGIYFNNNTWSGMFDTDIIICYWSSGWSGYSPMPAATLAGMGFKMVNTNGDYYWVLGKTDAQCSASKASGFNYKSFPGSTIDAPAGSMFCIWADYPGAETEASVLTKTADTIAAFGATLPKLSTTPVEPGTDIVITPDGGTSGSPGSVIKPNAQIKLTASKEVYWTSSAPEVVKLTSADTDVAAQAATYDVYAKSVYATAVGEGTAEILADDGNGNTATYSLTVSAQSTATKTATIKLEIGGTKEVPISGVNYKNDVDRDKLVTAIATVDVAGNDAVPEHTDVTRAEITYSDVCSGTTYFWQETNYYCKDGDSYYPLYVTVSYSYRNGNYTYNFGYYPDNSYSAKTIATETVASPNTTPPTLAIYNKPTVVPATDASTTITFTGVSYGTTYVTVGDTEYTIVVDYKQETVNVVINQETTITVSGTLNTDGLKTNVATVSVSGTTMTVKGVGEGDTSVIVGKTKYNIHVSTEDLEGVAPAKLEYWITNAAIKDVPNTSSLTRTNTESKTYTVFYSAIAATRNNVNTLNGIDVTTIAPNDTEHENRTVYYWHCRMLDTTIENNYGSKDGWQTNDGGDDETDAGVAFTRIRYYNGEWAVYTENSEWVTVEAKHQLVAYYKEYLKVTDEVESYAADWGNKGDGNKGGWLDTSNYCTLSIQVVYENGTTNPDGTTASVLTSKSFVYGYWTQGRGIGTVILNGTNDYEIVRVSAETGAATVSFGTDYAATITNLDWDKNELTVWEDENGSDEAVIHNASNGYSNEGKYANLVWDENKEAILLRVYVRAKVNEDSLTVNYFVDGDSKPFYYYNIAVAAGTYFDKDIRLDTTAQNPSKADLANGSVINIKNITQKVSANLSTMPAIGAEYRYVDYTCVKVEPVADEKGNVKTVNLYYTFDNTVAFIADFGQPVTLNRADINANLAAKDVSITKIEASGVSCGKVTTNNDTVTYTPDSRFAASEKGDTFTLTYTGQIIIDGKVQEGSVAYRVTILPASNVLYEENFLTTADGWTKGTSAAPTTAQETQKVGDTTETTYNVFGYDDAYKTKTGASGYYQASNLIAGKGMSSALTTEFYGNGFDLIGNCGPTTGRVFMLITSKDGGKGRIVDVDTRYTAGTLSQVPLAHVELNDGHYAVKIYAGGLTATTTSSQSGSRNAAVYASSFAVSGYDVDLNRVLAENGLTLADVEYTKISSASTVSAVSAYSVATYADTASTIERPAGTHVEIDGFRVYRSTTDSVADNYPTNEQNVKYVNILNAVTKFTAFVEGSGKDTAWTKADEYELKGGPQNEIYLRTSGTGNGSAVTFKTDVGTVLQISARAVENGKSAKLVINGTTYDIASNTEMYYTVTANENGIVTIKNTGDGMLALGNLKVKNGTTVQALSEEDYPAAIALLNETVTPAEPEQPTVFVPEHFSIRNYATPLFRHKLVTLRIDFSKDVSYVEIDGQKYYPSKFASWFGYYTVTFTDTIGRNDNYFYKVVFFDANGNPSETQSVYGN